jgi:nickel-dependent lactate racemase
MSAADRIVESGGTIIVAAECRDGFPNHGNFRDLLKRADSAEGVDRCIREFDRVLLDQWQVQILTKILLHAEVALYSSLAAAEMAEAFVTPIENFQEAAIEIMRRHGTPCPVAILPDGPLTIPYLV